jgi:hypothetical protein
MKKIYLLFIILQLVLLHINAKAQLQILNVNQEYKINFEETIPGVINGQFQGLGFSASPVEGQLNSNAWSVTGLAGGDMDFGGEGTTGSFAMGMADAGVDAGGIYAHPANGSSAKLMFQPSDDNLTPGSVILKIQNNTGRHIDYLYSRFVFYQYNDKDGSNRISFQVSDDDMENWDQYWTRTTTATAQTNPNLTTTSYRGFIPVSILPGEFVYYRWYFEDAGGGDGHDEMFVDEISVRMLDTGGYCIPQFSSTTAGAGINYFSLNNITNHSDIESIAWSDFTSKIINVVAGDTYDLKFRTGSGFGSRSPKAGVYVDWDQTGDFYGADDDLFGSYSFSGTSTQTLNFTVPADATHGDTRLRLVVVRDSYNALGPCVNGLWGEAEDYTLRVHPPGTCFAPSELQLQAYYQEFVQMQWTPGGNQTSWLVEAGAPGFVPGTGTELVSRIATSPVYTSISGFTKGTEYDIYVQSTCGEDDSEWVGPINFYTPLGDFADEVIEEFGDMAGVSWLSIPANGWQISDGHIHSLAVDQWLASPPVDITSDHIIRWDVSNGSESAHNTYRLWLTTEGFIHPHNFNVFRGEFTSISDSWEEVTVDLSAYQGERVFLAFEHVIADAGAVPLRIDNIAVVPLFCAAVSDVSVTNITAHQADISWTPGDAEVEWLLELGPEGFTPGNGEELTSETVFNNAEINLTGLDDNTFYSLYIQSRCGYSGGSIWVGPYDFTTFCGIVTPEYTADFTGNVIPDCWWKGKASQASPSYIQGQYSAWFFADDAAFVNYTDQRNDYLISKAIDLGDGSVQYQLEFDVRMRSVYSEVPDQFEPGESFEVRLSDDIGYQEGQNVFFLESNRLLVKDQNNPIDWEWEHVVIDLSEFTGPFMIGFYAESPNYSWNSSDSRIYVNNIRVRAVPACIEPQNPIVDTVDSESVTFSWDNPESTSSWNIEYGNAGFTPGTGTILNTSDHPVTISGLNENTAYEAWLQADCGGGEQSEWTGPISFRTTGPGNNCSDPISFTIPNDLPFSDLDQSTFGRGNDYFTTCIGGQFDDGEDIVYELIVTEASVIRILVEANIGWIGMAVMEDCPQGSGCLHSVITSGTIIEKEELLLTPGTYYILIDRQPEPAYIPKFDLTVELVDCGAPSYISAEDITKNSANIYWSHAAGQESFNMEVGTSAFTPGTDNALFTFSDIGQPPFYLEGLEPDTWYRIYSQSNCDETESTWSDFYAFQTLPDCPQPVNLLAENITSEGADIVWDDHPNATSWQIEAGPTGFDPGSGEEMQVHTVSAGNSLTLQGLDPNSSYDFYVRMFCGSDFTNWSEAGSFTTICHTVNIDLGDDLAVCPSDLPVILNAGSGYESYIWSDDAFEGEEAVITEEGTYSVIVTDALGCSGEDEINITVYPIFTTSVEESICEGEVYDFFGMDINESGIYTHTLSSIHGCDSIIELSMTVHPVYLTSIEESICEGEVFDFFGTDITESGIYNHTLPGIHGCDSIIELSMTVHPVYLTSIEESICEGEVFDFFGTDITESGIYTHTLPSIHGCDSIIELNITVHPVYLTSNDESMCEGEVYDFFGTDITESGIYTHTLNSIHGCDSIIELNMTVHPVYLTSLEESMCEGEVYDFFGMDINESGIYTHTLNSIHGCDSIIELSLTVHPVYLTSIEQSICAGEVYNFFGTDITESGIYTHTLPGIHGCDSIIELNMTVYPAYEEIFYESICDGEVFEFYGTELSESGIYFEVFTGIMGCDSIITLNLTVIPLPQKPLITIQDNTLESSALEGNQWYHDDNIIPGATENSFIPEENGMYTTIITIDGCSSEPADPIMVSWLNIAGEVLQKLIIYPNPGRDVVYIDGLTRSTQIEIYSSRGELIDVFTRNHSFSYNLAGLATGIYLFKFTLDGESKTLKVEKQ